MDVLHLRPTKNLTSAVGSVCHIVAKSSMPVPDKKIITESVLIRSLLTTFEGCNFRGDGRLITQNVSHKDKMSKLVKKQS